MTDSTIEKKAEELKDPKPNDPIAMTENEKKNEQPKGPNKTQDLSQDPKPEVTSPSSETSELPVVDNVQVISILDDKKETATQYHCQMADGTTRHVDKELFV